MYTDKKLLFLLFAVFMFYSCKNNPIIGNLTEIKISPKISDDEALQPLIKDLQIVKLQTTDSSLIKYITRIEYKKNKFYIQTTNNKPILVFDSIGNYKNSIGQYGKGPKEFIQLMDFQVDNKVTLFSWPDKTLYYTLDGKYLRKTKAILPFTKSIKVDNNLFALYFGCGTALPNGETPSNIVFTDSSLNIISKYTTREAYKNKYGISTTIFSKYSEGISYLGEYKDTVYLINNKSIIPQFYLNFGEYQISDEFLKKNRNKNPVEYFNRMKKSYAMYLNFSQSKYYFWIDYYLKQNTFNKHFAIYSKEDSKVLNFSCENNQPLTKLLSNIIANDDEKFIFSVEASDFKKISETIKEKLGNGSIEKAKYIDDILKISFQIKETDNPLLLILTLKHNQK